MIPQPIFSKVMDAYFANHGAEMTRKNKSYSLRLGYDHNDNKRVEATVHFNLQSTDEIPDYERRGFFTSKGNPANPSYPAQPPRAWKKIPLSQVPKSQESEWDHWDEF